MVPNLTELVLDNFTQLHRACVVQMDPDDCHHVLLTSSIQHSQIVEMHMRVERVDSPVS